MSYANYVTVYTDGARIIDNCKVIRNDVSFGLYFPSEKYSGRAMSVRVRSCEDRIHYMYSTAPISDLNVRWVERCVVEREHICDIREEHYDHTTNELETPSVPNSVANTLESTTFIGGRPPEDNDDFDAVYDQQFEFSAHVGLRVSFHEARCVNPTDDMLLLTDINCRFEMNVDIGTCYYRESVFPFMYTIHYECSLTLHNLVKCRRRMYEEQTFRISNSLIEIFSGYEYSTDKLRFIDDEIQRLRSIKRTISFLDGVNIIMEAIAKKRYPQLMRPNYIHFNMYDEENMPM